MGLAGAVAGRAADLCHNRPNTPSLRLIPAGEHPDTLTGRRVFHFRVRNKERMSIVRETLRQQDASFISLREVLELLTKDGEGCTLVDAAAYLSMKLQEAGSPKLLFRHSITRERYKTQPGMQITLLNKIINVIDFDDDVPF